MMAGKAKRMRADRVWTPYSDACRWRRRFFWSLGLWLWLVVTLIVLVAKRC